MVAISLFDLYASHSNDKYVSFCLITNLLRDPAESMLITSFWFLLEIYYSQNIVAMLPDVSDDVLTGLVGEAVACLQFLRSPSPRLLLNCATSRLSQTSILVGISNVSL